MEPTTPKSRCPECGASLPYEGALYCPKCHASLAPPLSASEEEELFPIPRDPFAPGGSAVGESAASGSAAGPSSPGVGNSAAGAFPGAASPGGSGPSQPPPGAGEAEAHSIFGGEERGGPLPGASTGGDDVDLSDWGFGVPPSSGIEAAAPFLPEESQAAMPSLQDLAKPAGPFISEGPGLAAPGADPASHPMTPFGEMDIPSSEMKGSHPEAGQAEQDFWNIGPAHDILSTGTENTAPPAPPLGDGGQVAVGGQGVEGGQDAGAGSSLAMFGLEPEVTSAGPTSSEQHPIDLSASGTSQAAGPPLLGEQAANPPEHTLFGGGTEPFADLSSFGLEPSPSDPIQPDLPLSRSSFGLEPPPPMPPAAPLGGEPALMENQAFSGPGKEHSGAEHPGDQSPFGVDLGNTAASSVFGLEPGLGFEQPSVGLERGTERQPPGSGSDPSETKEPSGPGFPAGLSASGMESHGPADQSLWGLNTESPISSDGSGLETEPLPARSPFGDEPEQPVTGSPFGPGDESSSVGTLPRAGAGSSDSTTPFGMDQDTTSTLFGLDSDQPSSPSSPGWEQSGIAPGGAPAQASPFGPEIDQAPTTPIGTAPGDSIDVGGTPDSSTPPGSRPLEDAVGAMGTPGLFNLEQEPAPPFQEVEIGSAAGEQGITGPGGFDLGPTAGAAGVSVPGSPDYDPGSSTPDPADQRTPSGGETGLDIPGFDLGPGPAGMDVGSRPGSTPEFDLGPTAPGPEPLQPSLPGADGTNSSPAGMFGAPVGDSPAAPLFGAGAAAASLFGGTGTQEPPLPSAPPAAQERSPGPTPGAQPPGGREANARASRKWVLWLIIILVAILAIAALAYLKFGPRSTQEPGVGAGENTMAGYPGKGSAPGKPGVGSPANPGSALNVSEGGGKPVVIYWRTATSSYMGDHHSVSRRALRAPSGSTPTFVRVDVENFGSKPVSVSRSQFSFSAGGKTLAPRHSPSGDMLGTVNVPPKDARQAWLLFMPPSEGGPGRLVYRGSAEVLVAKSNRGQ